VTYRPGWESCPALPYLSIVSDPCGLPPKARELPGNCEIEDLLFQALKPAAVAATRRTTPLARWSWND
jgi:hypothetical protein